MHYMQLRRTDSATCPVGDRLELDARVGYFPQELVGRPSLPFRPELAQERSRLAPREPVGAEALAQVSPQLCFDGPRAQIARGVEPGIDVREVVRGHRLDAQGVREELDVAGAGRGHVVG